MSWLTKNYPIGRKIEVPHPTEPGYAKGEIVNHTIDTVSHPMAQSPTGIMVKFPTGQFMEIPASLLDEDGKGL